MKKKLVIFAMIAIVLLNSFCFIGCSKQEFELKKSDVLVDYSQEVLDNLAIISSTYENRTSGSEAEVEFLKYLENYMKTLNYTTKLQKFTMVDNGDVSYNLISKKESLSSKKTILLACQYDNCYELLEDKPNGAYESGMAISVLMSISKILSSKTLPYNVTIVYFGSSVQNYEGARNYIAENEDDISLMINYSMLGGGDNLYMYSRDIEVNYNQFFYAVAKENNLNIKEVPKDKRLIDAYFYEGAKYDYLHFGMFGNHYPFMNEFIPTISYASFNWEDKTLPTITEVSGKDNVYQTNYDTYANMLKRVGTKKLSECINNVINSTIFTIVDNHEGLLKELENPDEMPKFLLSNIVDFVMGIAIKIVFLALFWIIAKRMQDKAFENDELKKLIQDMILSQSEEAEVIKERDPFDFDDDKKE